MVSFITRLIANNISQVDYVLQLHNGPYPDAGHAERFIGVGIGFKEVHLRNLTYFAHLDTVEEGAPDLDVGVKILGSEEKKFWHDHKSAKINTIRTKNAIEQADQFLKATEVNALALTKLDGTAKGGIVFPLYDVLHIPVNFIGTGETIKDLAVFNSTEYIDNMLTNT